MLPGLGLLAGLNPKLYFYGGIALLLVLSHTGVYFYGKAVQRMETEKENVAVLVEELEKEQIEGHKFAKQAEQTGREVAEMEAQMGRTMEELREAINDARSSRLGCDLSDDELRGLQELYDSYR